MTGHERAEGHQSLHQPPQWQQPACPVQMKRTVSHPAAVPSAWTRHGPREPLASWPALEPPRQLLPSPMAPRRSSQKATLAKSGMLVMGQQVLAWVLQPQLLLLPLWLPLLLLHAALQRAPSSSSRRPQQLQLQLQTLVNVVQQPFHRPHCCWQLGAAFCETLMLPTGTCQRFPLSTAKHGITSAQVSHRRHESHAPTSSLLHTVHHQN